MVLMVVTVAVIGLSIGVSSSQEPSGTDQPSVDQGNDERTTTTTEATSGQDPSPRRFHSGDEVRVAVRKLPPFIEKNDERYSGFTADLWKDVADRLGLRTRYVEVSSVGEQLDAVQNGDADLAATAISITSEREQSLDFSTPYFDGGLQIMVPSAGDVPITSSIRAMLSSSLLMLLGFFLAALVLVGTIVALIERRKNPEFAHGGIRAVTEGMWWAIVTVATVGYGDTVTRTHLGRLLAGLWIVFGLVFVAHFTATVTTNMTVRELQTDIHSPADLPGRKVVTVRGTTAARYLKSHDIAYEEVDSVTDMADRVASQKADAAVYDSPILAYQVQRIGPSRVALVGSPFTKEYYGIAFPAGSPMVEEVDRALLKSTEDGTYDRLVHQWFPEKH